MGLSALGVAVAPLLPAPADYEATEIIPAEDFISTWRQMVAHEAALLAAAWDRLLLSGEPHPNCRCYVGLEGTTTCA